MHQNKTIGIIGGMGPLATADLFRKIVELTDGESDQDYPRVLIDSNTNTPDRTEAILRGGPDPVPEIVRSALLLERGGADVLIMGCNTAHYFYPEICRFVRIPFLNMPEETAKAAEARGFSSAGLLATGGTVRSGVYAREFDRRGMSLLTPDGAGQEAVTEMIYRGVKAGRADWPTEAVSKVIDGLGARGAQAVILGCTELPVAFAMYRVQSCLPLIDPTEVLAASAIRFVGGTLRRRAGAQR